MKEKATLILDLGNSLTRVRIKFLDLQTNKIVTKKIELSNRFYNMKSGATIPSNYKPDSTSVILVEGDYAGYYANGEIVEKEYEKVCMKPTANQPKYSQLSALSFSLAVVNAIKIIAGYRRVPKTTLDIEWDIVVLMPATSCTSKEKNLLVEEFKKIKKVSDIYTEDGRPVETIINVGEVTVFSEGFAAYVGCMYNKDLSIRKGYERYTEEAVLVLDIGAGTSDWMVIVDSEIIDNTRDSANIGGNNVRAKARKLVKSEYSYDQILDSQLEEAMITGKIKDGAKYINVSKEIMLAKGEVAKSLVDEIQEYLNGIDFSLRTISGLLPVGGGTLSGDTKEIVSISEQIVEFLKQFSPNIEIIELPEIENEEGEKVRMSARDLNIEGASILSEVE